MPVGGLGALAAVEAVGLGRGRGTMVKAVVAGAREGAEGGAASELGFHRSSMAAAATVKLRRNPSSPRRGEGAEVEEEEANVFFLQLRICRACVSRFQLLNLFFKRLLTPKKIFLTPPLCGASAAPSSCFSHKQIAPKCQQT